MRAHSTTWVCVWVCICQDLLCVFARRRIYSWSTARWVQQCAVNDCAGWQSRVPTLCVCVFVYRLVAYLNMYTHTNITYAKSIQTTLLSDCTYLSSCSDLLFLARRNICIYSTIMLYMAPKFIYIFGLRLLLDGCAVKWEMARDEYVRWIFMIANARRSLARSSNSINYMFFLNTF